jgi:methyl coenzyme M reductase subunit D
MKGEAFTLAVEDADTKFVDAIEKIIKKNIPVDNSFAKVESKSKSKDKYSKNNTASSDVVGFGDEIPAFMLRSC